MSLACNVLKSLDEIQNLTIQPCTAAELDLQVQLRHPGSYDRVETSPTDIQYFVKGTKRVIASLYKGDSGDIIGQIFM